MLRHFLFIVQRRMGSIILYGALVPSDVTVNIEADEMLLLSQY